MDIYSISEVTTYLKELLETNPHLADLWVSSEVSNLTRSGAGHTHFTLKDDSAQIRCVMFRRQYEGGIVLENGAQGRTLLQDTFTGMAFVWPP